MSDDLLDSLNDLVNAADKPGAARRPAEAPKAARAERPAEPKPAEPAEPKAAEPVEPRPAEAPKTASAKPKPAPEPKPAADPRWTPPRMDWTSVAVGAVACVAAFGLGVTYGAIVASGRFPEWYRPGLTGAATDWMAAPAGILLLPVIAALLASGGLELRREGSQTASRVVLGIAGLVGLAAVAAPFLL